MRATSGVLLTAALLGAQFAAPPLDAQQPAPIRIRIGTMAPQGTSYHRILQELGERWRTATNGRVQVTIYAGTMGSELELVRRMRLGQLQAAALTVIGLQEIDLTVNGLQYMPMMFRTLEEEEYVRTRLQPLLERRLLDRGFVALFWADAGWVRHFARSAALRPEDFRRLKIFVTAGDIAQYDMMRAEGYSPVALEWADALTALRTGMIDAIPSIPFFALSMQYYTVASHMLEVNWLPLVGAAVMTRSAWESLPAESRAAIRSAAAEAGRQFQARGRLEADSAVAAMQRRGLTVHPMPPALEAEWRAMSERLYPRIRGSMVPPEIFDEVVRLLAEYRSRPGGRE
ncbi:MAG: TRAP transporter substrate-binding protein DctP [Gemmatimonadota bacterium]